MPTSLLCTAHSAQSSPESALVVCQDNNNNQEGHSEATGTSQQRQNRPSVLKVLSAAVVADTAHSTAARDYSSKPRAADAAATVCWV
jgi:hypothetical protein